MTELEAQLLDMLNQEREEMEREKEEQFKFQKAMSDLMLSIVEPMKLLSAAAESLAQQNQQIIELLQKPSEGDNLETTLRKVLSDFQTSLIDSLTTSLASSKS